MKKSLKRALLTGAVLLPMITPALAHEDGYQFELYVRGMGGLNKTQGMEYDINAGEIRNEHDKGYVAGGAVGLDMGDYALELEVSHRSNDIDHQSLIGTALPDSTGSTSSTAVMVNGYYEIPTDSKWDPYLGVGVGYASVNLNDHATNGTLLVDDGSGVFAYQAMAGMNYNFTDSFAMFAEYRYFATATVDITTATNTSHSVAYENHGFLSGIKYTFK